MEKDYRMVRLTDGTTIMGSIVVDKDFLRITNALELNTVKRSTEMGMKDDSTLAPWLPFTDDKTFVIPRDKILVITQADQHISHYYEVILKKVEKDKEKTKPTLSAEEMEKINGMNIIEGSMIQVTGVRLPITPFGLYLNDISTKKLIKEI